MWSEGRRAKGGESEDRASDLSSFSRSYSSSIKTCGRRNCKLKVMNH